MGAGSETTVGLAGVSAGAAAGATAGRAGFTLDLDRCTGCSACAFACRIENDLPSSFSFRQITTFNPAHVPGLPVLHLSLACNHCERPACLAACPTGAYTKDPTSGAVVLHTEHCMGCAYCAWVCPYGAPQFDDQRGVMTKCTFCASRVERGDLPACVVACPVAALDVLGEHETAVQPACVPGFPDTTMGPAIRLLSRWRVPAWRRPEPPRVAALRWNRLRKEWPLAVFTFLTAALVGWWLAGVLGGPRPQPSLFLILAMFGGLVSTLHLGRPSRMARVLRNVRTSWISREIACFTAFLASVTVGSFVVPSNTALAWLAAGLGLATLGAMDRVYRVPGQAIRALPHSAMTLLTGLYLAGALSGHLWLFVPAGSIKLWLYVTRQVRWMAPFVGWRLALPSARLLLGFLLPVAAWLIRGSPLPVAALAALLVAEALDRLEFYATLEFLGPQRQADLDARAPSRI